MELPLPAGWEPIVLQKQYLRLESRGGPALELKWKRLNRSFSPQKYMRRVRRRFPRKVRFELDEKALPGEWTRAAAQLRARGKAVQPFGWGLGEEAGLGAAVLCPDCGRSSLMNILAGRDGLDPKEASRFLAGFEDHQEGPWLRYKVFDFQAQAPCGFRLTSQSFQAGHFQLCFAGKGMELTLDRLGPANVILGERGLAAWGDIFFGERGGPPGSVPQKADSGAGQGLEWGWASRAWLGGRILTRLRRRPLVQRLRIWRPLETNKLLCVYSQGSRAMPPEDFSRICEEFRVVPIS